MLSLPPSTRIFVALEPVDMRGSFDALAGHVRRLHADPLDGNLYFFVNRKKKLMKILWFDRNAWAIYSRRLERGTFELPAPCDGTRRVAIDATQLAMILEGGDLALAQGEPARVGHVRVVAADHHEPAPVVVEVVDQRPTAGDEPSPQRDGLFGGATPKRATGAILAPHRLAQGVARGARGRGTLGVRGAAVGLQDGLGALDAPVQRVTQPQARGEVDADRAPRARQMRLDPPGSVQRHQDQQAAAVGVDDLERGDVEGAVFGVDGWRCPRCGEAMRLRTVVMPPATLRVIDSLHRSEQRLAQARAPPIPEEASG